MSGRVWATLVALPLLAIGCQAKAPAPVALAPEAGSRTLLVVERAQAPDVTLQLPARQWMRLAVRQQGVDATATVTDPAGDVLISIDSPSGRLGREPVAFLSRRAGLHLLRLDVSGSGELTVEVLEARPARPGDEARAAAARALSRGLSRWIADDGAAAEPELRSAIRHFEALGGDAADSDARRWLAAVLAAVGRLDEAAVLLIEAAAGFAVQGERHEEAKARTELALLWRRLGQNGEAERELVAARDLFAATANDADRALVLHHLGVLREGVGRLADSEAAYEEALALRQRLGDPCDVSSAERSLGSLYTLIGRDEEALDLLEAAVLEARSCGGATHISALIELAWGRHLVGDAEAALERLDQALALAREEQREGLVMAALDRRGTVLTSLGRYRLARRSHLEALRHATASGDGRSRGHVLANLGRLTRLAGDPTASLAPLRTSLPLLASAEEPEAEAFTRLELARSLRSLDDPEAAERQLDLAIQRVEAVRADLASAVSRSFFLSHRREIYDELIDLLMERAAAEPAAAHHLRALEVAERSRARSLLDSVGGDRQQPGAAADTSLRTLMAEIARLDAERTRRRRQGAAAEEIHALDRRLRRLSLAAEGLSAAPSLPPERLLTAGEIPGILDADTQLLVFSLGPEASYAWLIDATGAVQWSRLRPAAELEGLARRAAGALASSRAPVLPHAQERATRRLAIELLGGLAPRLAARRLAIVPDGALHLVPFNALPLPASPATPLLERFEVVIVPSPSALAAQRDRPPTPRPPGDAFVVADPVFRADDPRVGRARAITPAALPADLERAVGDLELGRLPRLPATRREARAILDVTRKGRSHAVLGFASDRHRVLATDLRRYRALHFATHAILHPAHPQLSGVVLSLVGPEGGPRDGFLRAWEIAAADLPVELVVLSACSTGLGREIRAEGLVGLPQAFFRAGARRVVVTHWPIHDQATAELMAVFYEGLFRRGLPPAEALAAAQRRMRADPRWSAPYHWAGFSLLGDWRPLADQQDPP